MPQITTETLPAIHEPGWTRINTVPTVCILVHPWLELLQNAFDVPLERHALHRVTIAHYRNGHGAHTTPDEAEDIHWRLARRAQGGHRKHRIARAHAVHYAARERRNLAEPFLTAVTEAALLAARDHDSIAAHA